MRQYCLNGILEDKVAGDPAKGQDHKEGYENIVSYARLGSV
jgi:hypothetical protein